MWWPVVICDDLWWKVMTCDDLGTTDPKAHGGKTFVRWLPGPNLPHLYEPHEVEGWLFMIGFCWTPNSVSFANIVLAPPFAAYAQTGKHDCTRTARCKIGKFCKIGMPLDLYAACDVTRPLVEPCNCQPQRRTQARIHASRCRSRKELHRYVRIRRKAPRTSKLATRERKCKVT